jgi:hypothetical protein
MNLGYKLLTVRKILKLMKKQKLACQEQLTDPSEHGEVSFAMRGIKGSFELLSKLLIL